MKNGTFKKKDWTDDFRGMLDGYCNDIIISGNCKYMDSLYKKLGGENGHI